MSNAETHHVTAAAADSDDDGVCDV